MKNLVLITSVINTPNIPLSYSKTRSVFTRQQRFDQTKKTVFSIKEKIPDYEIMIVECTEFTNEEKNYLHNECKYILNLINEKPLQPAIFGLSKSLGEGTMTIKALEYIKTHNIIYDNFIKISGRYWLSDNFNSNIFESNQSVFKQIDKNINNIFTALYKVPHNEIDNLYTFLTNNISNMIKKIGYEILFANYLKSIQYNNVLLVNNIGLSGFVTVCGSLYNG